MSRKTRGFSLVELMVVVGIALVVMAIAIPNIMTAISDYRLRSAASNLAALFQSARMKAIHDNRYYAVRYATVSGAKIAFVDVNNNNTFDNAEPNVQMPSGTSAVLGGGPSVGSLNLGWTPKLPPVRFNSQGFACAVSGALCSTNSGGYTVGFFQYVTDTRGKWAGVLVTPAGLVRSYVWTGSKWGN